MDAEPHAGPAAARRFTLRAALAAALAAVLLTWPLAARPDAFFSSRQDCFLGVWDLWWVAAAVGDPARELFATAALFFPGGADLASQPFSLLQSVPAVPLVEAFGPLVAFNLLALASFWLAAWAAALWARPLCGSDLAAFLGGLAFAFSPYHYLYLPELNLVAIGTVPVYLLAARALDRRPGAARGAVAGLALAAVALGSWYYAIAVGLAAAGLSLRRLARRDVPPARRAAAELAQLAVAAAVLAPVVLELWPSLADPPAPSQAEREGLAFLMEGFKGTSATVALPVLVGWIVLVLGAVALVRPRGRGLPLALALGFLVLSLGESARVLGADVPLPYALLQHVPGARAARYPDRFFVVASLGFAALAACGAADLARALERRRRGAGRAAGLVLVVLVAAESWPGMLPCSDSARLAPVPDRASPPPGAVLHAPTTYRNLDGELLLEQTRHGRPLAGGYVTRPDPGLVAERRADPLLGPFALRAPVDLPADLARGLRERGFGLVVARRAGAVEPPVSLREPSSGPRVVWGPFSLAGRAFLHERLFPPYPLHAELAASAAAWEAALAQRLGPPIAEGPGGAVFAVERP